jgi:type III secretion system low calcium response chaperone LcrH/SycD
MTLSSTSLSSNSIETLYSIAHSLYGQGKYLEAVDLFRLATIAEVKSRKCWMGLGASYQMCKKYVEAIEAYELAAALEPTDPQVHIQAANCYFSLRKQKEALFALDCAERAVKLNPNENILAHIELMRTMWLKK